MKRNSAIKTLSLLLSVIILLSSCITTNFSAFAEDSDYVIEYIRPFTPYRTKYFTNSKIDKTGLIITAYYQNGEAKLLYKNYTVSGFDTSSIGKKTLTITYFGKTTQINITVESVDADNLITLSEMILTDVFDDYQYDYNGDGLINLVDLVAMKKSLANAKSDKTTSNPSVGIKNVPAYSKSTAYIEKIGGFSYIYNQMYDKNAATESTTSITKKGITFTKNLDGSITANGTATDDVEYYIIRSAQRFYASHYYYISGVPSDMNQIANIGGSAFERIDNGSGIITRGRDYQERYAAYIQISSGKTVNNVTFYPTIVDLTLAFGAGNEPYNTDDPRLSVVSGYGCADSGTLKKCKITAVNSLNKKGREIDTYYLPAKLLNFLSDKGYGESCGNDYNYIDFTTKKYYKKGNFENNIWIADEQVYDIGKYINGNSISVEKEGAIRFVFENDNKYDVPNEIDFEVDSGTYTTSKEINFSNCPQYQGTFDEKTLKWFDFTNKNNKFTIVPIEKGDNKYTIKSKAGVCYYCFVRDMKIPRINEPLNSSIYVPQTMSVASGKSFTGTVPIDTKYIIINTVSLTVQNFDSITIENTVYGESAIDTGFLQKITVGAHNIRDFNTVTGGDSGGCPDDLADTYLPLWKNHFSKWLNCDFLSINEWYPYFDKSHTINSYETFLKQFYPYYYEMPIDNPDRIILSKHKGVLTNLASFAKIETSAPMIICKIGGENVAVVCWEQSSNDTPKTRQQHYANAITYLAQFDKVILAGDFNNGSSTAELSTWTDAGYTLGNGGYWDDIVTWESCDFDDNIVTKGFIYENFEVNDDKVSSDHKAVKATLSYEMKK